MTVATFFKSLLPIATKDVETLSAEAAAAVKKINDKATADIAAVKASHSVNNVSVQLAADIAAARAVTEKYIALLKAKAEADLAVATNVLPPLNLTGSTGVSGPTGTV